MKTSKKIETPALPVGITPDDLTYPKFSDPESKRLDYTAANGGQVSLYEVTGFGWVIATLGIAAGGKFADRTYGVKVDDGSVVRVGKGPHVKRTFSLYFRKNRMKDLQKYLDLYNTGLEKAGMIRDRISTRRAQGALRRADGFGLGLWG
jgi:hypothetical protein